MEIDIKEDLQDVKIPIKKLPTYVNVGGIPYPAGYAIVDMEKPAVLKAVAKSYEIITNEELMRFIKRMPNISFKKIHISNDKCNFYINGNSTDLYVKDVKGHYIFLAFEIGNSYAGRFFPYINISLWDRESNTFIKTPLKLIDFTRGSFSENGIVTLQDNINKAYSIVKSPDAKGIDYELLSESLPVKYRLIFNNTMVPYYKNFYGQTIWGNLLALAKICEVWSHGCYEVSRATQWKWWESLTKGV